MLSMVLQSLLGLAFVLGLFALVVWGVRRFQLQNGAPALQDFRVVRRIHIDSKNSIVEIRHEGRRYLLGLSAGGMIQLRSEDALACESIEAPDKQASTDGGVTSLFQRRSGKTE